MEYQFSNRMSTLKASTIREILKTTSDSDIISLAGGNPSPDAFPVDAIKEISQDILDQDPVSVLQYGISEGDKELIEQANLFFNRHETVTKENDGLIITSGSQQIIEFAAKCLCNEGDLILVEDPTFVGAINSFKSLGVKLKGIPFKEGQIDLEALEEGMKEGAKLFYTIPNFQNPTGLTMSLEVRKEVLRLAKKYQVLIVEDNPYGDLRFEGESLPSLKALDNDGFVIYAASLSKIIAPGMRIALCVAPKEIIDRFTIAKQVSDIHSNLWSQKVMARFLRDYDVESHLTRIRTLYQDKCQAMLRAIEQYFSNKVAYTKPQGGLFIWATLSDNVDVDAFVEAALKHGVAVVSGKSFMVDENQECHWMRLNFSMPDFDQIDEGIKILGKLTYEFT